MNEIENLVNNINNKIEETINDIKKTDQLLEKLDEKYILNEIENILYNDLKNKYNLKLIGLNKLLIELNDEKDKIIKNNELKKVELNNIKILEKEANQLFQQELLKKQEHAHENKIKIMKDEINYLKEQGIKIIDIKWKNEDINKNNITYLNLDEMRAKIFELKKQRSYCSVFLDESEVIWYIREYGINAKYYVINII